jgi:SAM-dependent methyltransferase
MSIASIVARAVLPDPLVARLRRWRRRPFFPESALAHRLLDGLAGLEIGGSAHNAFGLDTKNVDVTDRLNTVFKRLELQFVNRTLPVDIVAPGDDLPVDDESQDFVISSHVLEHFPDPIKALREWYRVIRKGGYIYMIVPHKERTFDQPRPRTTLNELLERNRGGFIAPAINEHYSVWITEDVVELVEYLQWKVVEVQDVDDKVGNGFTVVVQKPA